MANDSIEGLFDLLFNSVYLGSVKEAVYELKVLMRQTSLV
jgi:hypothetical protein